VATRVAIFGGPGAGAIVATSIAALAADGTDIACAGFLNDVLPRGTLVSGAPVLGPFAAWRELPEETLFVAPLHNPKAMAERKRLIEGLGVPAHRLATIVDPRSSVARDAVIGPGSYVGPFADIGPSTRIGAQCVVRAGARVSHDCTLRDFVCVGMNAVVCGYVRVEEGAYIAPNATIGDRRRVGRFAVVGMGAVVTKDVPGGETVFGIPAAPARRG
jgi:sugar O-acyltransferase (sialic acid O-acetyltransferase NeuD family)